jgi:hypothetical protein
MLPSASALYLHAIAVSLCTLKMKCSYVYRQAQIIFISRSVKFYYRSDHISYMYVTNCYITIKLSMLLLECWLQI